MDPLLNSPEEEEKRRQIQEAILQRLAAAQSDTAGIDEGADNDRKQKVISSIGQALSGLATADSGSRGGYQSDTSHFQRLADSATGQADAQKAKRAKIESIIQEQALRSKFGDEDFDKLKFAQGSKQSADKLAEDKRQFDAKMAADKNMFDTRMKADKEQSASRIPAAAEAPKPTVGSAQVDKEFAKSLVDYEGHGGDVALQQSIKNLEQVSRELKDPKNAELTGGPGQQAMEVVGNVRPFGFGVKADTLRGMFSPDVKATQQKIQQAVLPGMKALFPGAISNQEAEMFTQLSWDPQLSPAQNASKLESQLTTLKQKAKAMKERADYWRKNNGTLTGFNPAVEVSADAGSDADLDAKIKALESELGIAK